MWGSRRRGGGFHISVEEDGFPPEKILIPPYLVIGIKSLLLTLPAPERIAIVAEKSGGEEIFIRSMSEDNQAGTSSSCCASCGIAECDDIKLKECDGCDLVRYWSDECQQIHQSEHEEACKKRAAELRDELLFKQPESTHMGDCPICSLPLPLVGKKSTLFLCCSKVVCNGCRYAHQKRQIEQRLQQSCPFCRELLPETEEEIDERRMKRVEVKDPVAICREGGEQRKKGDNIKAFDYFTKAAELGDADAHYKLPIVYLDGVGVEKDEGKASHHWEEAAIRGHPVARYNLGWHEGINNKNSERAVKHWIIAAAQGHDGSIKELMKKFREGYVSKEELASALRAHKTAVDATKSPQREVGEQYFRSMGLM